MMIQQIEALAQEIQSNYPPARVFVEKFPSGNILLDISMGEVTVEMAYLANHEKLGVSLVDADSNPFDIGYDAIFGTFNEAKAHVLGLVKSLIRV
jgi:hypothetical protein